MSTQTREGRSMTASRKEEELADLERKSKIILLWMEEKLKAPMPTGDLREALVDGVVLCKLANVLKPGCIRKFHRQPRMLMMKMENIAFFLTAAQTRFSVPQATLFAPTDIHDDSDPANMLKVLRVILMLAHEFPGTTAVVDDIDLNPSEGIEMDDIPEPTPDSAADEDPPAPTPAPVYTPTPTAASTSSAAAASAAAAAAAAAKAAAEAAALQAAALAAAAEAEAAKYAAEAEQAQVRLRLENEKIAAEKAAAEKAAAEKAATDRAESERRAAAERDRLAAEKAHTERVAAERAAVTEKAAAAKVAAERAQAALAAAERAATERAAAAVAAERAAAAKAPLATSSTNGTTDGLDIQPEILKEITTTIHKELTLESKLDLIKEIHEHVRAINAKLIASSDVELRTLCHTGGLGKSLNDVPTNKPRQWYVDWIIKYGRLEQ